MNDRILRDIGDFIFVSDILEKSDVIFIPGSSDANLPEKAAELYGMGYAPLIMPSGRFSVKKGVFSGPKNGTSKYRGNYKTECEFFTDVLVKNGVPKQAVIGENRAGYTRANAFFTAELAASHGLRFQKAIIVCKSFHARRCLMLYQTAFPETELLVCPIKTEGIEKESWYKTDYGRDRVLGEFTRCGSQFNDDMENFINGYFLE